MFDTRALGRRPGAMQVEERTVAAPYRIGLDLIAIAAGAPIEFDLRLESVVEGVLVSGTARAEASGECSRCLGPLTQPVELHLTELYAYPGSITESTTDDDEVPRVEDDAVDLEQLVVDTCGLELPLQPLCREDCVGLCLECGIDLAIAEPGHRHDRMDPRWAALAAKFGDPAVDPDDQASQDFQSEEN